MTAGNIILAFDRAASVRSIDRFGRLHVEMSNISKATVNPYKGHEIPDYETLGLEKDGTYMLLRDPAELARPETVASANNIQLLSTHKAVTAKDPQEKLVAGSTGTDAVFEAPYLKNSLVIWRQQDIDDVNSRDRCELSCSYHYRPDMTSGTYEGQAFDGVMRDILFNHVALVEEGRAGPDVIVGDSKEKSTMPKANALVTRTLTVNALMRGIMPRLAQDAQPPSFAKALNGVTGKNFIEKTPVVLKRLESQLKGHLAQDATMGQIAELLDMVAAHEDEAGTDESVSEEQHKAMEAAAHGHSNLGIPEKVGKEFVSKDKARDWMKGRGMSDDDFSDFEAATAEDESEEEDPNKKTEAEDEPPPFEGKPEVGGGKAKDKAAKDKAAKDKAAKDKAAKDKAAKDAETEKEKDMVSKGAMDAAMEKVRKDTTAAVLKTQRDLNEALALVRPIVGDIHLSFDSAGDVFKHVLEARKIDLDGVDPTAYRAMVKMLPKAGERPGAEPRVAMDAAAHKSFAESYPGAASIRRL